MKYTCPCCYKTLGEEPPDTYEICEICFWEDDAWHRLPVPATHQLKVQEPN
jgi:hypothetical protein